MKQIKIQGGHILRGEIPISGAKNGAVALVPASLLCDETVTIDNIPDISDIAALNEILEYLGATVTRDGATMTICSEKIECRAIPEDISKKLRASYYFMSAMLGKFKQVEMYFPGGCSIGARPIDQTLKAFIALGAEVIEDGDRYTITAKELKGAHIYLDVPSVGATINAIFAAVKATGKTIIENAAKEPEIVSIATFLNNMGAKITGVGTSKITIQGVSYLHGGFTEVIPDRIEAGTYLLAGALIGDHVRVTNMIPKHLEALLLKLEEIGYELEVGTDYVEISAIEQRKPVKITTLGYPGFATDLQQPITVLLTQCNGDSFVEETIYENRFGHIPHLNHMGANIEYQKRTVTVHGKTNLHGHKVEATDLRAGASMILAGLVAEGETTITSIEHVLRGYEHILEKLRRVGAKIELEEIN